MKVPLASKDTEEERTESELSFVLTHEGKKIAGFCPSTQFP